MTYFKNNSTNTAFIPVRSAMISYEVQVFRGGSGGGIDMDEVYDVQLDKKT